MAGKDPYMEINRHLRTYRSTPHPTTGEIPAEMLFGRKYRTKLPDGRRNMAIDREDIKRAREEDRKEKEKQKRQKDGKIYVKKHTIQVGDQVLKAREQTKNKSPYEPEPFTVVSVHGSQITAARGTEVKTRDSQKFKKVRLQKRKIFNGEEKEDIEDADIGCPRGMFQVHQQVQNPPQQREEKEQLDPPQEEDGAAGVAANTSPVASRTRRGQAVRENLDGGASVSGEGRVSPRERKRRQSEAKKATKTEGSYVWTKTARGRYIKMWKKGT